MEIRAFSWRAGGPSSTERYAIATHIIDFLHFALMVLLTLTPAAKSAVELYNQLPDEKYDEPPNDPSLSEPTIGAPVSHAQLIQVARCLRESHLPNKNDFRLDALLKGANLYVPPPKPRPQPVCAHLHYALVAIALYSHCSNRLLNTLL